MRNDVNEENQSLLAEIASGDHHAFRTLFDEYHVKVFNYAIKFVKSEELAEEIVQDIFMKIWNQRKTLLEVRNFGGYLRTMSTNMTLDALKKIAVYERALESSLLEWTDADNTMQETFYRRDSQAYVDQLLSKLPQQQRIVYTMFYIDGLKQREVAENLNISLFTVKAHLRQALKNLRTLIGDNKSFMLSLIFLGLLHK